MLKVNFIIIYVIHKISVLLKTLLQSYDILKILLKRNFFFLQHIMMESSRLEEENIIKDIRNLIRLEKLKKKQLIPQLKI